MAVKQRLIDANYLVNKGIRNCPIEEGGIPLGDFAQHQKILELYPTVDAVEVVHGRWLTLEEYAEKIGADTTGYIDGWSFCSECEQQMRTIYGWFYCPNCGAKMDGDGNDKEESYGV